MPYRSCLFLGLLPIAIGVGAVAGCSVGADSVGPNGGAPSGVAGAGGTSGAPGLPPATGGSNGLSATQNQEAMPPGRYIIDPSTPGENACAGTTLGAVLAAVRAAYPELADITTIYNPARQVLGDGSFVYPYQQTGGGFAVVLKRGLGDCPSGCTENFFYYFETDAACVVAQVGRYHASWGDGTCLSVEGIPRWSHPPPPNPAVVCGADNSALDQRGTYAFAAFGQSQACVVSADKGTVNTVQVSVTVTITQDASDLSTGTVTLAGTGHPLVDGVALPARFSRQRFEANVLSSNLPSTCPREHNVAINYDFETDQPGALMVFEYGSDSCAPCKGYLNLSLTRAF